MGQLSVTIVTSFVVVLTYYLVLFSVFVSSTPTNTAERSDDTSTQPDVNRNAARIFKPMVPMVYAYNFNRNIRTPFSNSISPRLAPAIQHKIQPLELDLLVDDDDFIDKSKRYDDYGHMRFGKRGGDDQFDDYGHMRFGKRGE